MAAWSSATATRDVRFVIERKTATLCMRTAPTLFDKSDAPPYPPRSPAQILASAGSN
jgi:hypothetical protein